VTVLAAEQHVWRLSQGGEGNFGVCCTAQGLLLGRTTLVEHRGGVYVARSQGDLERLLRRAYGEEIAVDRVASGLAVVAAALEENNLALAQIAALLLRLPDLPDLAARDRIEAEDARLAGGDALCRSFDPARHPRAGVPPNPGWFAPAGGPTAGAPPARPPSIQIAQNEEERAPEELLDPVGPVRQAVWEARIALLRRIDPDNANLTYFANPKSPPSQAALARLDAAIEAAAVRRVTDKVMPGGRPIGRPGDGRQVRELPGGPQAAADLFEYLRVGGQQAEKPDLEGLLVRLPGRAGYITFRATSRSGSPAIDINVPGISFRRIHFY
jgi:hypothetical protein